METRSQFDRRMPGRVRTRRAFARSSCSSVTGRAAGEPLNLIFVDQPASQLQLVRRRGVVDAENLIARPYVQLRIAMAVDAPFHLQRLLLPHQRHAVDLSVTGGAADAFMNVDAVIEVDKVGQIV